MVSFVVSLYMYATVDTTELTTFQATVYYNHYTNLCYHAADKASKAARKQ